jgi:hypothetical protein
MNLFVKVTMFFILLEVHYRDMFLFMIMITKLYNSKITAQYENYFIECRHASKKIYFPFKHEHDVLYK